MELADTSAWILSRRADRPELRAKFDAQATAGEISTCDPVKLELLYSARSADEFRRVRGRLNLLVSHAVDSEHWGRALEVYEALAESGGAHQRRVKHMDLLIAAAAEAAEVPVLHYDEDYDRIAEITGQVTRWLAPRGSV